MLQLEYSLEKQEFQEFVYYANWLSPEQKDHRFKYYFASAFSYLIITLVLGLSFQAKDKLIPFVFFAAFIGIFLFFYIKSKTKSYPYQVAEDLIVKEGGQETILARRELTISETGIILKQDFFESKFTWQAFRRKIEHNRCFYLYTGPRDAIIIPHRIFISRDDLEKFQQYMLEYVPLQADFPTSK